MRDTKESELENKPSCNPSPFVSLWRSKKCDLWENILTCFVCFASGIYTTVTRHTTTGKWPFYQLELYGVEAVQLGVGGILMSIMFALVFVKNKKILRYCLWMLAILQVTNVLFGAELGK